MAKANISNRVFRLKFGKKHNIPGLGELDFVDGEEFHIVGDVIYMRGHMLPPQMQQPLINWVTSKNNRLLFIEDTRNF